MRIFDKCLSATVPMIAAGLAVLAIPQAQAGGTATVSCAAVGDGLVVQTNGNVQSIIVTLAEGDTLTVVASQDNAEVVNVTNEDQGGLLASLGPLASFNLQVGDGDPNLVGVSPFGVSEANDGDSAIVSCVLAANAPPPPEELGAEAPDGVPVAPSTLDVQRAFTSRQMMTHLSHLYEEMHRNSSGVLRDSSNATISQNKVFLQSAGKAAKDIPGAQPKLNVFLSAELTSFDADSFDGLTGDLILGLDYRINRDTVVGGLVGVGRSDFSTLINTNVGSLESTGLTIGIYGAARVVGEVTVDGLLTYSGLDYDVANGGTTGDFDANRFGISVGIYNRLPFMGAVLEPHARFMYGHEAQGGYTDSVGRAVGSNTVNAGRVVLGPRLIAPTINGFTPWLLVNAVYEFSDSGQLVTGAPDFGDTLSGRVGLGFDWETELGEFGGELTFGGLGTDLYNSVNGTVSYSLTF